VTKIIINARTYREACLSGSDANEASDAAYDESSERIFEAIGEAARAAGFGFEVDPQGSGAKSYRVVDEESYSDVEAAHDFMQSPAADFWRYY
jgi:hypothetical protein